jgi:hypothetical protein
MPKIITYKMNEETKVYDSPLDEVDLEYHEKYIKFKHREFTIDNNYKITEHQNISFDTFTDNFVKVISLEADDYFGKCILFPQKICKSNLYPEELGILVNEGFINHDQYIKYRDTFHNSDKIQIEYSLIGKNYFIPEPIEPVVVQPVVVQAVEGERRGGKSFREKYLKYKAKYLALKRLSI